MTVLHWPVVGVVVWCEGIALVGDKVLWCVWWHGWGVLVLGEVWHGVRKWFDVTWCDADL